MASPFASCLAVLMTLAVVVQPVLACPPPSPPGETATAAGREIIAQQLADLGRPIESARAAAAALTAEDLVVLLANPAMIQPAGQTMSRSLVLGIIIIAALIAAAAASDSAFISFG